MHHITRIRTLSDRDRTQPPGPGVKDRGFIMRSHDLTPDFPVSYGTARPLISGFAKPARSPRSTPPPAPGVTLHRRRPALPEGRPLLGRTAPPKKASELRLSYPSAAMRGDHSSNNSDFAWHRATIPCSFPGKGRSDHGVETRTATRHSPGKLQDPEAHSVFPAGNPRPIYRHRPCATALATCARDGHPAPGKGHGEAPAPAVQ